MTIDDYAELQSDPGTKRKYVLTHRNIIRERNRIWAKEHYEETQARKRNKNRFNLSVLTEDQKLIYDAILRYTRYHLYSPTFDEIAERTDLTTRIVQIQLKKIEEKGLVRINGRRSITLVGYKIVRCEDG